MTSTLFLLTALHSVASTFSSTPSTNEKVLPEEEVDENVDAEGEGGEENEEEVEQAIMEINEEEEVAPPNLEGRIFLMSESVLDFNCIFFRRAGGSRGAGGRR